MVHGSRFDKKADRIMELVLKVGNMGHNRGSRFMVGKAVCGEEGVLDVQTHRRFNQSFKDIPHRLIEALPEDYVEWGDGRDERGVIL